MPKSEIKKDLGQALRKMKIYLNHYFKSKTSLNDVKAISDFAGLFPSFKKKFTFTEIINLKSFKKICETLKKK